MDEGSDCGNADKRFRGRSRAIPGHANGASFDCCRDREGRTDHTEPHAEEERDQVWFLLKMARALRKKSKQLAGTAMA